MRLYLDANIIVYFLGGTLGTNRRLIDKSNEFFSKAKQKKYILVISDFALAETLNILGKSKVNKFFPKLKEFEIIIERIFEDKQDRKQAFEIQSENYEDARHLILAKKSNCDFIVTENVKDFFAFENLLPAKSPKYFF